MKIKPLKQAFKDSVVDALPEDLKDAYLNVNYGMFQMGYLLGAATALLEQLPESREDILNHKCVQNFLITEDTNATS